MARGKRRDEDPKPAQQAPAQQEEERSRPEAVAQDPRSNVTDETIREHTLKVVGKHREFEKKREEMDSARGEYRAALKDAKKDGVDQDAIVWYIRQLKREPDDINREIRNQNRIARIMGLPIGTQLGLFDDGRTVASVVDEVQILDEAGKARAYNEGYTAGKAGKSAEDCRYPENSAGYVRWMDGHEDGTRDNLAGIGKTEAPDTAAAVQP